MIEHTYTEPVSKLLTLGKPDNQGWHDYLKMGITRKDIPELIRLIEDKELRWMERPADLPEEMVWANLCMAGIGSTQI
jgi:hypothetical protein